MFSRVGGLVLAVLATVAMPAPAAAQGVPLRVGLPSIPTALDPATALDGPVPLIARQVFDTLVQYREGSSDVEPGLATSWTVSRDGLQWTFRIRDGVRFHDGTPLAARHVAESLDRFGLAARAKLYPRQLSGGQQQLVGIARALVAKPRLLLADEPTGNLDHDSAEGILSLLDRLNVEFKKTIVMVTHDPRAASHGTRAFNLDKGSLREMSAAERSLR